jgi:GT2 family glycosyltransferase
VDTQTFTGVLGYCDRVSAASVEGWAYNQALPDDPLVMQVLIDGRRLCSVTCDLVRQDVSAAGYRSQNAGFHVAIPPGLRNDRNHLLEFRDLDGNPILLKDRSGPRRDWVLPKAKTRPPKVKQQDVILGSLDPVLDGGVRGWAYARSATEVPVVLDVFIDDEFQFSVTCDAERADVLSAGHPNPKVGLIAQVPSRYFDGNSHVLELRSQPDDPRRFETNQGHGRARQVFNIPTHAIVGQVDGLRNGAVGGWVFRRDRGAGTMSGGLQVLVTMQGQPVAQITARGSRADVAAAHGCDANCGFAFYPPAQMVAGRTVEFDFRVIPGGHALTGSPVRVNFPSLETVAAIRDLQEATDKIFAELWLLRDRLRRMTPGETYTVEYYDPWAREYQKTLATAPDRLDGLLSADASPPLVSIVCPAHRPRLSDFVAAVESVLAQTYPHWELIIVDDASRSLELTRCIAAFRDQDKRIKAVTLKTNRGISGATNAGVAQAKGRYVAFLDHDDLLASRAIEFMLASALRTGAQMLYSDEDKIDDDGIFSEVNFKPDWNYRLLLAVNYVCHLLMVERAQLDKVGLFRTACDGAQDHDIVVRLSEAIPNDRIVHVPEVLYHWRKTPVSTAVTGGTKTYAVTAGIRAIQDHLERKGISGRVNSPRGITCFEIDWEITQEPAITVIIPYREHVDITRACLEALWANTDYASYHVVLVDNWSVSDEALAFADAMKGRLGISVMRIEEPFNYSRLNNLAVAHSRSDLLLFMNNDVFVSDPGWLRAMVGEMLADPLVGIVGNKLLYPSGLVQHGGVILGVGGVADHAHKGLAADEPGYVARAICAQELSAVTAACMLCRRSVFETVGGFDEKDLQVAFNDVDLCLKVGKAGYRVIWTPGSVAEHRESLSRGDDMRVEQQVRFFQENETMLTRWQGVLSQDRFYHRAFSRLSGVFTDLGAVQLAEAGDARTEVRKMHTPASRWPVPNSLRPPGGLLALTQTHRVSTQGG